MVYRPATSISFFSTFDTPRTRDREDSTGFPSFGSLSGCKGEGWDPRRGSLFLSPSLGLTRVTRGCVAGFRKGNAVRQFPLPLATTPALLLIPPSRCWMSLSRPFYHLSEDHLPTAGTLAAFPARCPSRFGVDDFRLFERQRFSKITLGFSPGIDGIARLSSDSSPSSIEGTSSLVCSDRVNFYWST